MPNQDGSPTESALAEFPLLGLSQRKSVFGYQPGELSLATNVAFDKLGRLVSRPGNTNAPRQTAVNDKPLGAQAALTGPSALTCPVVDCFQYGMEEIRLASWNRLYATVGGGAAQASRDYFPEAVGYRRPLQNLSGALDYLAPDVAVTTSGYEVYAWNAVLGEFAGASPIYATVYEQATGAVVLQPLVLNVAMTAVWTPKLAVIGGTLVVCVYADTDGTIYMRTLDTSGAQPFGWSAELTLYAEGGGTDPLTTPVYDITVMAGDTQVYVAWTWNNGGTYEVQIASFTTAGAAGRASFAIAKFPRADGTAESITAVIPLLTLCGDLSDYLYIAVTVDDGTNWVPSCGVYNVTTGVAHVAGTVLLPATYTKTAVSLPQQMTAVWMPAATALMAGAWNPRAFIVTSADDTAANAMPVSWTTTIDNAGTLGAANGAAPQQNWWPSSRPIVVTAPSGLTWVYAVIYYPSQVQGTYWLACLRSYDQVGAGSGQFAGSDQWARPVCATGNRLATSVDQTQLRPNNSCANLALAAPGKYITPGHIIVGGGQPGQFRLWKLAADFLHPNRGVSASIGHSAVFGSSIYDGQRASEFCHYLFPEGYSLADGGAGGALSSGTYQGIVIYAWTSASGETIRSTTFGASNGSPPTQAVSQALSASHKLTWSLLFPPPLSTMFDAESNTGLGANAYPASSVYGSVNAELYRTAANGTTFYLAAVVAVPQESALGASCFQSYTDNMSDATLLAQPQLYFIPGGGGALENVSPPSFSHTALYVSRIFGIGDDLRTIWYSKQYADGETPGFNESNTIQIEDGSDLVCLVGYQTQLLVCSKAAWYVVYGSGPDDGGNNSDFTQPLPLNFEALCSNILSLCQIPQGVVFQASNNQLYIIGASLTCTWFSDHVEDYCNQYPYVTDATFFPGRHELRVSCRKSATSGPGIVLVFNTFTNAWTVWSLAGPLGAGVGHGPAMMANVGGVQTYRWSDDNTLWSEDALGQTWLDAGAWVMADVEMGWINLPQIVGGYARVRKVVTMGEFFSPHAMTVSYGSNYNPSYAAPTGMSEAFADDVTSATPEELIVRPNAQMSHAFRVRLTTGPPAVNALVGTGQGCSFAAVTIEYGEEEGAGKFVSTGQEG